MRTLVPLVWSSVTGISLRSFMQQDQVSFTIQCWLLHVGIMYNAPLCQTDTRTDTTTASVVQSHLSRAVRCRGQPTTENSLSQEREESATVHAASVLPHHLSGTIYRDTSETMAFVVNNSLAIWRHFCLHGPIRQRRLWERLLKRRFINGLTYLLTIALAYRAMVMRHVVKWCAVVIIQKSYFADEIFWSLNFCND